MNETSEPAIEPPGLPCAVVGIGASAGGIEAFRTFFTAMPPASGLSFVVVLHLPADRKSILPEILGRFTAMAVTEIVDGEQLRPDHVHVPPAGCSVTLRNRRLHLSRAAPGTPRELHPINLFFESLSGLGEDAIGIVLSGTGNDGALGLKAIKERGGLTLAQGSGADGGPGAPGGASDAPMHAGMPESAIATGAVDIVTPAEDMPNRLLAILGRAVPTADAHEVARARVDICGILASHLGHDFLGYKEATFMRRVRRRMQVMAMTRLADYVVRITDDRTETMALFRDLLIGVTSFFRDADTFDRLASHIIPGLFEGKGASDVVRVWVPGCATGEEAYSLAILLCEYAAGLDERAAPRPRLQLFATDINETAIAAARAGCYPTALLDAMSPERRRIFFIESEAGMCTVSKALRSICTFSAHSLTRDPPFSRIDLVSCRNLLIYLDNDLQGMVIPSFHYSLVPNGVLLLGSSESIARHAGLFTSVDKSRRIYRRRDVPGPPVKLASRLRLVDIASTNVQIGAGDRPARSGSKDMHDRASTRMLERFGPAFVVVTADGDIVRFSTGTGRFLEPASGMPSQNVHTMARRGLAAAIRMLLKQVVETGRAAESRGLRIVIPGESERRIKIAIERLPDPDTRSLYLVAFIETDDAESQADGTAAEATPEPHPDRQLLADLRDAQDQLQGMTEEHETALEELKSTNEELLSVNEELQSANEELETAKEEIQSINEELQTVNNQLAGKLDELDRKNSDLRNLFESTEVATIFLDPYMIVRSFTPAVASIYNLIPSDIGRPLADIVSRVRYTGLRDDNNAVLNTLEPMERRVMRDDGVHYLMRILPYRSPDSTVDGTLVTFVDVTSVVAAEQHQRMLVDELNHRVKNMLTVVISIARQTIRRATTLEDFSGDYMGRIHALSATCTLLGRENWQNAALGDIVAEELDPFRRPDDANIVLEGPRVLLRAHAAVALGMAIHELTTNAVKHGALSVPDGIVQVAWRLEPAPDGEHLVLDWKETNGPPVETPAARGFGLLLIERGLRQDMSAEVDVVFALPGLRATIRAPIEPTARAELVIGKSEGPPA